MSSIIKVDTIQNQSGANIISESSNTITVGASGDTITVPSGATITSSGTVSGGLAATPAFSAYMGSAQTGIANATNTVIVFDSEDFDSDSAYNTSNGRFTVPTGQGGKYFLAAQVRTNSSGSMIRCSGSLVKNGSTYLAQFNNNQRNSGEASTGTTWTGTLAAGDYVNFYLYQDSGSAVNAEAGSGKCIFHGFRIVGA